MKHTRPHHAPFLVWLLGLACLGGGRAPAQNASTNEQPPVASSVADLDSEVNSWSARAAQALRVGQPDSALPWLQRLLQADPATMVSSDGMTFRPARKAVAELIRAVPERTLAAYRAQTEFAAGQSAMTRASTGPAALEARYREAPSGAAAAEAGLRLAGFYLDQGRFVETRRLLRDLLDECPAANRSLRADLLARLVVACAQRHPRPRRCPTPGPWRIANRPARPPLRIFLPTSRPRTAWSCVGG